MNKVVLRYRRPAIIVLHLALVLLSNYLAFWLRFDGDIPGKYLELMLRMLAALLIIRAISFGVFRLYSGLWLYTSIWELKNISAAVVSSSVIFFVLTHWILGIVQYPRSVFIVDTILLIFFLVGIRLPRRILREWKRSDRGKNILIYGAGDAGEMIVRDIQKNISHKYHPVAFVDDDRGKVGQEIHGIPIAGTRENIPGIVERLKVDEILIAIPSADPALLRKVVKAVEPLKLPIKTLPNLRDILDGRVGVQQIRSLAIEDLLTRPPVSINTEPVQEMIRGKRILVTGAGGSIGSEICRQAAAFGCRELIALDHYENGLHHLKNELSERNFTDLRILVADIKDARRTQAIVGRNSPDIIFHAAAHKHVPLMEENPCEAIKNNVAGTRILIQAATEFGVERFILISSDKAANPSSIMGATKRLCELMLLNEVGDSDQCYSSVRFGNVLASNGSVVPLFQEQIKRGGPVTIAHPEMRRYFMLISEAVQLVFQAATIGSGGAIHVLDMGDQIKIVDLARSLIRLSGFIPDEEIPIIFTGPRPGEKLVEELIGSDELVQPATVEGIFRVSSGNFPELSMNDVLRLEEIAATNDEPATIERLRQLVPTFQPTSRTSLVEMTLKN